MDSLFYKGCYFVYYNYLDAYPKGLGLETLYKVSRNVSKEELKEWVRKA
jgi:hypothetical protein